MSSKEKLAQNKKLNRKRLYLYPPANLAVSGGHVEQYDDQRMRIMARRVFGSGAGVTDAINKAPLWRIKKLFLANGWTFEPKRREK